MLHQAMAIDPRFIQDSGREVFTGNELLVKGVLESEGGVHLLTGYPDFPVSGFFDALEAVKPLLEERGTVVKIAGDEPLSVAMVNGVQMAGGRAVAAVGALGLRAATGVLSQGVLAGTGSRGGGLIVCGDDVGHDVTYGFADSRFLAQQVQLPMLEPSSPQEVKDWVDLAFQLGAAGRVYVGYLMTSALAHGGGTVECRPNISPSQNQAPTVGSGFIRDAESAQVRSVISGTGLGLIEMHDRRLIAVQQEARRLGINRIVNRPQKGEVVPLGFVASGVAYAYLRQALAQMGLAGRFPILKLGLSYPVDPQIVTEFGGVCRRMIVVEERRGFVEGQIVAGLWRQRRHEGLEVYGKHFPGQLAGIPAVGGLNPSILIDRLVPLIKNGAVLPVDPAYARLSTEFDRVKQTGAYEVHVPDRTPTFCGGCPHRDVAGVLSHLRKDLLDPQYMLEHHKRKPVGLNIHSDEGCSSLLMFEPHKALMSSYSGSGLGGGAADGVGLLDTSKQIVFMGDQTFYRDGQATIGRSIQTKQDVTYVILDNKTFATESQWRGNGDLIQEQDGRGEFVARRIERIIRGMIPKALAKTASVVHIDPADRQRLRRLFEQAVLAGGVKVVVADKQCGVTHHRDVSFKEQRTIADEGFLPRKTYMNIAAEVCDNCLECTRQTGCPGLKTVDTDYGQKIQTDSSGCVNDGACQRIHACPSFEEVTVIRKQPPLRRDEQVDWAGLPDPPRPIHADQGTWRCHLAGIGGTGIDLCREVLAVAGHGMGYRVQFFDQKGVAVRHGGVVSQIGYTRVHPGEIDPTDASDTDRAAGYSTAAIPYGKADLIMATDLLEAVRGIDPRKPHRVASPDRTAVVVNTAWSATVSVLMGHDSISAGSLQTTLRRYTHPSRYFGFDAASMCERVLGAKRYVNMMLLGVAYQNGFLPLKQGAIENAIRDSSAGMAPLNLRAFRLGRAIVAWPSMLDVEHGQGQETALMAARRKLQALRTLSRRKKHCDRQVRQFRVLMRRVFRLVRGHSVDDRLVRDMVIRVYDCLVWGGGEYAKLYCDRITEVFRKDHLDRGYALTRMVVWNLAKVMLIKDEIYVAALLTSPEKRERDRRLHDVDFGNGDKIIYRQYHQPQINLFGWRIRFEWKSRDWQLRLLSRLHILRGLWPRWHQREVAFRDWYVDLVGRLDWDASKGLRDYQRWLAVLSVPESVTGFREVRYPKMEAARQRAEKWLATDPQLFEPEGAALVGSRSVERTIHLPVMTG